MKGIVGIFLNLFLSLSPLPFIRSPSRPTLTDSTLFEILLANSRLLFRAMAAEAWRHRLVPATEAAAILDDILLYFGADFCYGWLAVRLG